MKQKLLNTWLLLAAVSINAQAQHLPDPLGLRESLQQSIRERFALKDGTIAPVPTSFAGARKSTVLTSRLTSYVSYRFNGTVYEGLNDSTGIYWSGTRGRDFDYARFALSAQYAYLERPTPSDDLTEVMIPLYRAMSVDSMKTFGWDGASGVYTDPKRKEVLTLNNDNRIQSGMSYDYIAGTWEQRGRSSFDWDGDALTLMVNQNWDGAAWENSSRRRLTYNANGALTENVYEDWDGVGMDWENNNRSVQSYTGSQPDMIVSQRWDDGAGAWRNLDRIVYGYDNGELATTIEQDWEVGSTSWLNIRRSHYTWGQGRVSDKIVQTWDGAAWKNGSKFSYTFDASGNYTLITVQSWDGTLWVNNARFTYGYASAGSGSTITMTGEKWNVAGSEWENENRMTQRINEHDRITEVLFQAWDPGGFWDVLSGSEKYAFTYETFEDGTSSINELNSRSDIRCYPNPATTQITVEALTGNLSQLRLTDVTGRAVKQATLSQGAGSTVISVADLVPGMYFLQAESSSGTRVVPIQVNR